jgi:hypothetical protein
LAVNLLSIIYLCQLQKGVDVSTATNLTRWLQKRKLVETYQDKVAPDKKEKRKV